LLIRGGSFPVSLPYFLLFSYRFRFILSMLPQRSARIESERAKQSFEIQQEAELTLSQKFKGIVSDLRRSWEEEETGRAMQLEERLRSHYSVVRCVALRCVIHVVRCSLFACFCSVDANTFPQMICPVCSCSYLYCSSGSRAHGSSAQDGSKAAGSILKLVVSLCSCWCFFLLDF
jgi:hypothetical protein